MEKLTIHRKSKTTGDTRDTRDTCLQVYVYIRHTISVTGDTLVFTGDSTGDSVK